MSETFQLIYVADMGDDGKWGIIDKHGAIAYDYDFDTQEEAEFVADYHNHHPQAEYERDVLPAWEAHTALVASAGAGDAVADAKPTYAELQAEVARLRADLQSTEDNELSFLGALQIIANWLRGGEGYRTEDGFTAQSIYDMVAKEIGLNAADATWIDNTRQQLADMRAALQEGEPAIIEDAFAPNAVKDATPYAELEQENQRLRTDLEKKQAELDFEVELSNKFLNEIWEIVGDGQGEWDYPAQIIRFAGYMKEDLAKARAWSKLWKRSAKYYRIYAHLLDEIAHVVHVIPDLETYDILPQRVRELQAALDQERADNVTLRAELQVVKSAVRQG